MFLVKLDFWFEMGWGVVFMITFVKNPTNKNQISLQ